MSRATGMTGEDEEARRDAAVPMAVGWRQLGSSRVLMTLDAVGGVWRYAMELAGALRPFGTEVVFAGLGPRPALQQMAEAEAIGEVVWLDEPLEWTVEDESALAACGESIARLAKARGADVIHLNAPSQAARLDTSLPVVAVSHSCVVTWWRAMRGVPLPGTWQWQLRRNRAGFRRAAAAVVPSRSHATLTQQCYGFLPRLEVVYNATGAGPAGVPKEAFVFAAARWWDEAKNGRVLDRAAAEIGWPVRMAGAVTGPSGQLFEIGNAEQLGELPRDEMRALMARAGIVVSPSCYEPFGLVALEAAKAGCALVLSDIPTYRELWQDAAAFFDPQDEESLARAVNDLISHPEQRVDLARRARARAERFSPAAQAGAMADIYASVTGAKGLPAPARSA